MPKPLGTPWPPLHAYALAHACPTCKAGPGETCDAPRKNARAAPRAQASAPLIEHNPIEGMHAARQDAGARHYWRDVGNAPWPEDREPGRRYDTLGPAWQPTAP